jgi:putative endopeptidase
MGEKNMGKGVMRKIFITAALALLVLGISLGAAFAQTNDRGLDPQNFDDQCPPCRDFDQYANGTWKNQNPIPAEYTSWGAWNEVRERNLKIVRRILEETASTQHPKGSIEQKVGDYYYTAMDTVQIETAGARPLTNDLARIDALDSPEALPKIIADYHRRALHPVFDVEVEQDLVQSDQYIVYATQGGLGLPERDYYLKDDEESQKIREQYVEHVGNMMILLGDDEETARKRAATVLAFETRLAEASLDNVALRNPENYYNILPVAEADLKTPNMSWTEYFATLGLADLETFSYAHPEFFAEVNKMITEVPLDEWKSYLRWHLVTDASPYLSSDFVTEDFRFYRQILAGAEKQQPRWKRVQNSMNWRLGETVGQIYVAEAFPPEAKARALDMIEHIRAATRERLEQLEWMGPETKEKALAKLETFTPKIGYPDTWRDYTKLNIERDGYLANVRRAELFEFQRNLNKLGKPVDPTEWGMAPQIVNAYYNPLNNEIVFPAGILQPPFFDFEIDDAVNYGAMGAVIGHEMLHGFDDQGRKFDADGNMQNWWTDDDEARFKNRSQRLVDQYNAFTVAGDTHVNGELTLGENIADLGGLTVAYYGLQLALGDEPRDRIDGLTPEQRFFLSWAQVWRRNVRDEAIKLQVNTDPHSPAHYRVNGPLSNMPEFYEAFGCEDDDKMVNPINTRVTIW